MTHKIADLRKEYATRVLLEDQVEPDPIAQFQKWFTEALACEVPEPNAMALATATADGKPSCRIVLLKGYDERGFVFFTNYTSHKGMDMEKNPYAALTFFWIEMERQVRIEGRVEKVPETESDIYFHSRPVGSQIGAWASPQSQPVDKRDLLDNERDFQQKYAGEHVIPRPPYWGGYVVIPAKIEFWQGRPNRLHDRIEYQRDERDNWTIARLAP